LVFHGQCNNFYFCNAKDNSFSCITVINFSKSEISRSKKICINGTAKLLEAIYTDFTVQRNFLSPKKRIKQKNKNLRRVSKQYFAVSIFSKKQKRPVKPAF